MTEMLTLSGTRAIADGRIATFRRVFAAVLALEAVFALILLIVPDLAFGLLGLAVTKGTRVGGGLLLWAALLQVPGQLNPVHDRLPVVLGVIGRGLMGFLGILLGAGYWILGVIALVFAVVLFLLYQRVVTAELMTRP